MSTSPEPTQHEHEQAAVRARMAREIQDELDEAIAALGAGAESYACWVLKDKTKQEPDQAIYCCRRPDTVGWQPSHKDDGEPERMKEPYHEGWVNPVTGEKFYPLRWQVSFYYIGAPNATYKPKTAEELAAARVRREQRATEALAADMPLLAAQIHARELPTKTKNVLHRERDAVVRSARVPGAVHPLLQEAHSEHPKDAQLDLLAPGE